MNTIFEFILFKRFLMPVVLQILFWAAIAGNLYGVWWLYSHGNWAWIMALLFGLPLCRLIFENFLLRFQTYQCLSEIRNRLYENDHA